MMTCLIVLVKELTLFLIVCATFPSASAPLKIKSDNKVKSGTSLQVFAVFTPDLDASLLVLPSGVFTDQRHQTLNTAPRTVNVIFLL